MTLKIKGALFRCGRCGKSYANPFGHTCVARTDYKRRSAKAKKDAAAARRKARPQHPQPAACRDAECKRAACAAYRQGREDGYRDGYEDGFPDGIAACPREHK